MRWRAVLSLLACLLWHVAVPLDTFLATPRSDAVTVVTSPTESFPAIWVPRGPAPDALLRGSERSELSVLGDPRSQPGSANTSLDGAPRRLRRTAYRPRREGPRLLTRSSDDSPA